MCHARRGGAAVALVSRKKTTRRASGLGGIGDEGEQGNA